MYKKINELVEIVAIENRFNLEKIYVEELNELEDAYNYYLRKLEETYLNKKEKQKIFEEFLHEIADVYVVRYQIEKLHLENKFSPFEHQYREFLFLAERIYDEYTEYIDSVIYWKLQRTLLRNKECDYYA